VPSANPPRRVLIVNADRRVRRDLAQLLALTPELDVAGTAPDVPTAQALLAESEPDVVVVDPRLPSIEMGFAFIDELRRTSGARIVVLTHDELLEARAQAHGADAFLTECDPPAAIVAAVAGEAAPA
jgi:DNA-binding NarL/FixJ family response regulator